MKENDVGIEFIGRQGFDAVYEKYKNLIFQTAFLYIKEWYAAEDIMQETFLRYYIYESGEHKILASHHCKEYYAELYQR